MRLPNAPLVEVIFELRWQVERTEPSGPVAFGYDPGFSALTASFHKLMSDAGYRTHERVAPPGPSLVHQIVHRYRQKDAFPLVQIGHGILACNISTEYEWTLFRQMIADNVGRFLNCYPDTSITPLVPCHLELRYVDVFNDPSLIDASWQKFMSAHTKMNVQPLKYLEDVTVGGSDRGNLGLRYDLKKESLGRFELQIANGETGGTPGILVTSKVVKLGNSASPASRSDLARYVLDWAEGAHDVTHNFFESFVGDELMATLKRKRA